MSKIGKVMEDYEKSSNSSAISDASKRVELILDKTRGNRKKIFYWFYMTIKTQSVNNKLLLKAW